MQSYNVGPKHSVRIVKPSAYRALLADVLPFELPLALDNRAFFEKSYRLKLKHAQLKDKHYLITRPSREAPADIRWLEVLVDAPLERVQNTDAFDSSLVRNSNVYKICGSNGCTVPYRITDRKSEGSLRHLSVPHPLSQLQQSTFLHDNAAAILFSTSRSPHSLRSPKGVAKSTRVPFGGAPFDDERGTVEQIGKQYKYLTNYFTYGPFNHINRFYDSELFSACERKYGTLLFLDISHCFDSIYTHTIEWSTAGRTVAKNGSLRFGQTDSTFGSAFDKLMQNSNYRETNGIIVGPETSRIFAEIILQQIDIEVRAKLRELGLLHRDHYEYFRYVDDCFIFLRGDSAADTVKQVFVDVFAKFKLNVNHTKSELQSMPLSKSPSVARRSIVESIESIFNLNRIVSNEPLDVRAYRDAVMRFNESRGTALSAHAVITSASLSALDRTVQHLSTREDISAPGTGDDYRSEADARVADYLISIARFGSYVYKAASSATTSIKLVQLYARIDDYISARGAGYFRGMDVRACMREELRSHILGPSISGRIGIHRLNLLDCLHHVGENISPDYIGRLLGDWKISVSSLDAIELLVLLRVNGKGRGRAGLKAALLDRCRDIINQGVLDESSRTERTLLRLSLPFHLDIAIAKASTVTDIPEETIASWRGVHSSHSGSAFDWSVGSSYLSRLVEKVPALAY